MVIMVTGGCGSGKSEYAENRVLACRELWKQKIFSQLPCNEEASLHTIYVATMYPYGGESYKKIDRHRKMRENKQFETVECYTHLEDLKILAPSIVLLECMSNLIANERYQPEGRREQCADVIRKGILHCRKQTEDLIIVTNEVSSDGIHYDSETMQYIRVLGEVNRMLAQIADEVVEVVYGIPVFHKKARW